MRQPRRLLVKVRDARVCDGAPAVLRVRRPSGRVDVFEATVLEADGHGLVWATGRWRSHAGPGDTLRYSAVGTYAFGAGEVIEIRAA